MIKLRSIPPAHRNDHRAAPQEWQPHRLLPVRRGRGHVLWESSESVMRVVLERKLEQIKEVEGFLVEGLELGLQKFAEELKEDIKALRLKLGDV